MIHNTQEPPGTKPNLLLNIVIKWRKGAKQIPKLGSRKRKEQLENREKKRLKISMNEENVISLSRNKIITKSQ